MSGSNPLSVSPMHKRTHPTGTGPRRIHRRWPHTSFASPSLISWPTRRVEKITSRPTKPYSPEASGYSPKPVLVATRASGRLPESDPDRRKGAAGSSKRSRGTTSSTATFWPAKPATRSRRSGPMRREPLRAMRWKAISGTTSRRQPTRTCRRSELSTSGTRLPARAASGPFPATAADTTALLHW